MSPRLASFLVNGVCSCRKCRLLCQLRELGAETCDRSPHGTWHSSRKPVRIAPVTEERNLPVLLGSLNFPFVSSNKFFLMVV